MGFNQSGADMGFNQSGTMGLVNGTTWVLVNREHDGFGQSGPHGFYRQVMMGFSRQDPRWDPSIGRRFSQSEADMGFGQSEADMGFGQSGADRF